MDILCFTEVQVKMNGQNWSEALVFHPLGLLVSSTVYHVEDTAAPAACL